MLCIRGTAPAPALWVASVFKARPAKRTPALLCAAPSSPLTAASPARPPSAAQPRASLRRLRARGATPSGRPWLRAPTRSCARTGRDDTIATAPPNNNGLSGAGARLSRARAERHTGAVADAEMCPAWAQGHRGHLSIGDVGAETWSRRLRRSPKTPPKAASLSDEARSYRKKVVRGLRSQADQAGLGPGPLFVGGSNTYRHATQTVGVRHGRAIPERGVVRGSSGMGARQALPHPEQSAPPAG